MSTQLPNLLLVVGAMILAAADSAVAAPETNMNIHMQRDGVLLTMPSGALQLQVWSDRIIRVTFAPEDKLPSKKSLSVIAKPAKVN